MFRLFQLDVPRSEFDAGYKMGWTEAMSQFPRIEAHMALTTGGSEGWVSDYDQFFKHVADINVRDLEDAFLVHNNPELFQFEERITRYDSQHSMSVGDILVGEHGDVHMVDPMGFTQLLSSKVGAA